MMSRGDLHAPGVRSWAAASVGARGSDRDRPGRDKGLRNVNPRPRAQGSRFTITEKWTYLRIVDFLGGSGRAGAGCSWPCLPLALRIEHDVDAPFPLDNLALHT